MKAFFSFDLHNTNYRREVLAGFTTFITMAYIIVVNPAILETAGIPRDASVTATILAAALGTFMMAFYAKRPFAVAPLMGENAFIAFTVVGLLGYSWQVALGAVFVSGILFAILTIVGVRELLAKSIPSSLKQSFAVGIGLFLTFVGLHTCGIISADSPVRMGDLEHPAVLLAVLNLLLMMFLIIKRIRAAIIVAMAATTVVSIALGITPLPASLLSLPTDISRIAFQIDIAGALEWGMLPVILTVFIMVFVDTLATLFGLSVRANLLDKDGNLPEIEKPMLTDAVSTSVAALLGTTTAGAYAESAVGIEAGGRTGFTSVVVASLFLLSLIFTPLVVIIPAHAYAPSLIIVGLLMLEPIRAIPFDDYTELVPAFLTIVLMVFSFNIGVGMTTGFVTYPLLKLLAGRVHEVRPGMWILGGLSLLFFLVSPQ